MALVKTEMQEMPPNCLMCKCRPCQEEVRVMVPKRGVSKRLYVNARSPFCRLICVEQDDPRFGGVFKHED